MTDDEIDTELRQADKSWNVMILSGAMVGMMRADPALTFAKFEERLRALGSKTFLIARPKRMRPAGMLVLGLDGKPREHFLWICLHDRNEQRMELAAQQISPAENLENLRICGVLAVMQ